MAVNQRRSQLAARVVFVGAHKKPSYVVESYQLFKEEDLGEGEILLKLRVSTICENDLEALFSPSPNQILNEKPRVIGHEGVGEVLFTRRISEGSEEIKAGDRLVFSRWDTCTHCEMCIQGFFDKCSQANKYGEFYMAGGVGLNGSFASHIIIKKGTAVAKVPDHVSDKLASPVNCSLATAYHAIASLKIESSPSEHAIAVVQGAGLAGIYTCALLHEAGYKQIYCHDSSPEKLKLVQHFNGIPVLVKNCYDIRYLKPASGSADVIFKMCHENSVIPVGIDMLRPGGCYVMVSIENGPIKTEVSQWNKIVNKSLTIKGISGYNGEHLKSAVDFLSKTVNKYPFDVLLGPQYSLVDFPSAIATAMTKRYHRIPITNVI